MQCSKAINGGWSGISLALPTAAASTASLSSLIISQADKHLLLFQKFPHLAGICSCMGMPGTYLYPESCSHLEAFLRCLPASPAITILSQLTALLCPAVRAEREREREREDAGIFSTSPP